MLRERRLHGLHEQYLLLPEQRNLHCELVNHDATVNNWSENGYFAQKQHMTSSFSNSRRATGPGCPLLLQAPMVWRTENYLKTTSIRRQNFFIQSVTQIPMSCCTKATISGEDVSLGDSEYDECLRSAADADEDFYFTRVSNRRHVHCWTLISRPLFYR